MQFLGNLECGTMDVNLGNVRAKIACVKKANIGSLKVHKIDITSCVWSVNETQSSGTPGGTLTQQVWTQRTLNTIEPVSDTVGLSSNALTFAPGTYLVNGQFPAFSVGSHKARMVCSDMQQVYGTNAFTSNGVSVQTTSTIAAIVTFVQTTTCTFEHYVENTNIQGAGTACNIQDVPEIYSIVSIIKIG